MPVSLSVAVILLLVILVGGWRRRREAPQPPPATLRELGRTARRFYTRRNFLELVVASAGGAAIAYSGLDQAVQELHAGSIRSSGTDAVARVAKQFGETDVAIATLGFALADYLLPGTAAGRWGRECFTATATGLPVLWSWQRVLGGSRPSDEKPWGPRFRPLADENSVSGHTFVSAIPFLIAARQVSNPVARWGLRALSPVTGWSRINDERHYLSQVMLGYALAWKATQAADEGVNPPASPTTTERPAEPA
jgi:hypothetical protein